MMTVNAALSVVRPVGGDGEREILRSLIDWPALCRLGWDPKREVFAPAAGDPVFGFVECGTAGCTQVSETNRWGLCCGCVTRWRRSFPEASLEEFCRTAPPRAVKQAGRLCLVCWTPGHERPAHWQGLCASCVSTMGQRGQDVTGYINGDGEFGPAAPRPSFGCCQVAVCERWSAHRRPALCEAHYISWVRKGQHTGQSLATWCARQRTLDYDGRTVVLRGLGERAQMEMLFGLWCRAQAERRTTPRVGQMVVNLLWATGAVSVVDLAVDQIHDERRLFVIFTRDQVRLAMATPDTEATKDDWDLRVFGRDGKGLHFGQIHPPWLKQAAKCWARERLDTAAAVGHLERLVQGLGVFSESLDRHRADRGTDPILLGRADVSAFSNDLAHLEAAGRLSRHGRGSLLRGVAQFLREARSMGLGRPGGPLAGLPDDVMLGRRDQIPGEHTDPDEHPRALPQVVVDQLLAPDALELLEANHGADARAMVELEAEVGRRTGELCGLRWGCLAFDEVLDEAGRTRPAPVLVHDMPKVGIRSYHLPISEEAAAIIRAQQARVRDRYPDNPTAKLALFPAGVMNPRGTKACSVDFFGKLFRTWVDGLPELVGPGGEPYERSAVITYSWRHCYAQRHADQGTPIEVLAGLMGHSQLSTTQGYYRVTQQRKRKAVDLMAKYQVDRAGKRSRPAVERLLEAEHLREAVGQVAVPFGICTNPTNVKAHGQACPFRHQCVGCSHFRSDPSFLPELRAYLARLLADQERLRAAVPELEEWARNGAIPSAEEIAGIRRVIDRCQEVMAELAAAEQAEIEEAIAVLRRGRAQLDTSVPVRFLGVIGQPSPTLFPNIGQDKQPGDGR
jgi:integrase